MGVACWSECRIVSKDRVERAVAMDGEWGGGGRGQNRCRGQGGGGGTGEPLSVNGGGGGDEEHSSRC